MTELERREVLSMAEGFKYLVNKDSLLEDELIRFNYLNDALRSARDGTSIDGRVELLKNKLKGGATVSHYSYIHITGERVAVNIIKHSDGKYSFGCAVESPLLDTEEECLKAAASFFKEW
jgi:hypothetical protein